MRIPPIDAKQPNHSRVIMDLSQLLFLTLVMTTIEHYDLQDAAIKPLPKKPSPDPHVSKLQAHIDPSTYL